MMKIPNLLCEVVDHRGGVHGPFKNLERAAAFARSRWPDQEQDEDRTGKGWDIQIVGAR
ncbi:hypothetical protein J6524_04925 [Bradyrhizobium sp. WSM 1738]|uniref:hypothetical protein n=1 Tax=Bradyrhizobium hereditatis TaxID=2821405 RepID=UPI001CE2FF28|nr:hypothetical protein [Bradyrhizobium hereditatis]MCA6114272.1 hypothetical protein [Bradyrhizobium hereditatis]